MIPSVFRLEDVEPSKFPGGTLRLVSMSNLPGLSGVSFQSVVISRPGDIQPPHAHANASELIYCVSGRAQVGFVDDFGTTRYLKMEAGDILLVPQEHKHWFKNIGDSSVHYLAILNHESPQHVEVSEDDPGIPEEVSRLMRSSREAIREATENGCRPL